MRIFLIALGSRGDVQPFIALALRLGAAGHAVRVLAAADYAPLAASYGVEFAPIVGSVEQLMDRELVYDFLDATNNPVRLAARFLRGVDWAIGPVIAACWQHAQDAELLVASTLGMFAALHIAEKLNMQRAAGLQSAAAQCRGQGVLCVPVHLHPYSATRAFPTMFAPPPPRWLPAAGAYNWGTHLLEQFGFWELMRRHMNRARRAVLQLAPLSMAALSRRIRSWRGPVLYGYSALVAPRPADWPERLHITGYWFLDPPRARQASSLPRRGRTAPPRRGAESGELTARARQAFTPEATPSPGLQPVPGHSVPQQGAEGSETSGGDWEPEPRLAAFLAAGPPPVYVGFGSTLVGRHPDAVTRVILDALARTGQRGVLYSAWGDLGNIELPDSVFRLESAPHAWLFPRMAAVVHHGGAGTTAAALRAGVPSVIVPVYGDQNFWARRVHALGAGVAPLPRMELNAERLAAALDEALSRPSFRARAAALGAALAQEDGVGAAVKLIEQFARHHSNV